MAWPQNIPLKNNSGNVDLEKRMATQCNPQNESKQERLGGWCVFCEVTAELSHRVGSSGDVGEVTQTV